MNCILLPKITFPLTVIRNPVQVKHIQSVIQAKVGDSIVIGEQGGKLGSAIISDISDDAINLTDIILDKMPPDKLDLTVVLALPRPKVLRRLIMDMTALGVNRIILVNSYRTEKSYWQSPLLNRLDEFVIEGLQQSIDTVAPTIELKKRFKPFVEDELSCFTKPSRLTHPSCLAVVAHPYASQSWQQYCHTIQAQQKMPKLICIGAEGGWIDYEVSLLQQYGCQPVSLGRRILRTESAVNVLLGAWL